MYNYQEEKSKLDSAKGELCFRILHQAAAHFISTAGSFTMQAMFNTASDFDNYLIMVCIDRMVELRHVREVSQSSTPVGQRRVFVKYS